MPTLKKSIYSILLFAIVQGCCSYSELTFSEKDYIGKLKAYPNYEYEETNDLPQFTYSDISDTNLINLRKTYELDKVAGIGDEISIIKNLMKWVHNTLIHDGSQKAPKIRNINSIIKVCKTENRGVNCRMHAIALNEVYLSFGFRSRYITCLPFNKKDTDCHVINAVFSNDLGKWIYIDSQFEVYFTDESGILLSIQEVRDNILNNKGLNINNEINYNGKPYDSSEYITYMTKNLFRLESPLDSEYNYEPGSDRRYIELVPKDYSAFSFNELGRSIYDMFSSYDHYTTSNPDYFWEK